MSTYVIKNGELYHARGFSNTNAGSKVPDRKTLRNMAHKYISIICRIPLTSINLTSLSYSESDGTVHFAFRATVGNEEFAYRYAIKLDRLMEVVK